MCIHTYKEFYCGISNIYHGVYLVYTPSHRVLMFFKRITANLYKPYSIDTRTSKATLLKPVMPVVTSKHNYFVGAQGYPTRGEV